MRPRRFNSKRQIGSRWAVDTVGASAGQVLYGRRSRLRDRGALSDNEVDCWCDSDRAKKPAAFAGLVLAGAAGIGMMMMTRAVLVDVNRADPVFVVIQAMCWQRLRAER